MKKKYIGIIAVVVLVAGLLLSSATVVRAGHTGVIVTLGAVEEQFLSEGFHFKIPFVQSVVQMNNQTKKVTADGAAASRDLQNVTYSVEVNYKVSNASSATLYRNVGLSYETTIIQPAIQESVKAVTANFTAEQLITRRAAVGDEIKETLQAKILPYGLAVEVFNIVNFDFSEEFNRAVEAKQTAQQNALKAQQDLERIEIEARQKVTQAQAEADSIKLIQEMLKTSPEYIEYIKWTAWNGVLPQVMTSGNSDFILDVSGITSPPAQSSVTSPPTQSNVTAPPTQSDITQPPVQED